MRFIYPQLASAPVTMERPICLPLCRLLRAQTKFSRWIILVLRKGQPLHKCAGFSGPTPHSLHIGSFGQFLFIKLFAMRIFLCSNVHAKNLHFGSALAFHIGMIRSLLYDPSNWMWYALLDILSICRPAPYYVVLSTSVKLDLLYSFPQSDVFLNFGSWQDWGDVRNPLIVMYFLLHRDILPLGFLE